MPQFYENSIEEIEINLTNYTEEFFGESSITIPE
jgi:hypothetical protein